MTRLAWHFLHPGSRLRTGEVAPPDGEWLVHTGPVVPCESGLHASERAIDALYYAPENPDIVACRVEVRGTIVEHGSPVDKVAASERRILWRLDGEATDRVLRLFAVWCARNTPLPDGRVVGDLLTDERSVRVLEVAERFAHGQATRDELGAARAAAWAAARAAAWDAARAAARDAARDAQNTELERLLNEAHEARS